MLYPIKLKAPLKDYLWGGTRLKEAFGKKTALEKVAESWELACHQDGMSVIDNGPCRGKTLGQYIEANGKACLGSKLVGDSFPLLIKFIDAHDNLSVQVHPDDAYAKSVENSLGKTEMWYIIDAAPGAKLIYGFKQNLTREAFLQHIEDNSLLDVCNQVPVKKGDVFFIPAGTLHAIGKNILIAEIQQSSNLTYRVYDYGRLGQDGKPRQLHVAKALNVTKLQPTNLPPAPPTVTVFADYRFRLLEKCPYFTVMHFDLSGNCALVADATTFHSLLILEGKMCLDTHGESLLCRKGDSLFLPANLGEYRLNGTGQFLLTTL